MHQFLDLTTDAEDCHRLHYDTIINMLKPVLEISADA
jgi:hypothetical protein